MPTCTGTVSTPGGVQDFSTDGCAGEVRIERQAKVLCAIDGRSRSDAPLQRTHAIARAVGAQVMLLHVVDRAQSTRAARYGEARACFLLDSYARRLSREGQDTQISIRSGRPHETIAAVAAEWDADLIVVGRYRERFGDSFTGTSAERIAHRAERPVLMVNQESVGHYGHVLLTADLSPIFVGVARAADQLGLLKQSRVSVVHALEHSQQAMLYLAGVGDSELGKFQRTRSQIASNEVMTQLARAGLGSLSLSIFPSQAQPLSAIDQVSRRVGADLIVIGSSRFPQFKRWFVGSVSNEVLRRIASDVLLVPPAAARRARKQESRMITRSNDFQQPALYSSTMDQQRPARLH